MTIRTVSAIALVPFLLLACAGIAQAQVITTPYNCGSYWSSQPCSGANNYDGYRYMYPRYGYYNSYRYYYPYTYQYVRWYPQPTCTLAAARAGNYYGYYGYYSQPVMLSWSSNNATSGYISPTVGSVSAYGQTIVYPNVSTTYTMTVYGPGGSNACSTTYYQATPYYQQYNYQHGYPYYYY